MKIFLSILLAFTLDAYADCRFAPHVKEVISLSGTITVTLKELGLLNDPKLKGLSVFSPVSKNEYSGTFYPGGIFLSQASMETFKNATVFFDESRELSRAFKKTTNVNALEIVTRGMGPVQTMKKSEEVLKPYVVGCDEKLKNLRDKINITQEKLLSKIPKDVTVIFFLGEMKAEKFPEMIVAQDGVVKLLNDEKKIKTYPSSLAYVNWSAKILNQFSEDAYFVGLKDSGMEGLTQLKRSSRKMTLIYPGVLVPGLTQLEAFLYLFENL